MKVRWVEASRKLFPYVTPENKELEVKVKYVNICNMFENLTLNQNFIEEVQARLFRVKASYVKIGSELILTRWKDIRS